MAPSDRRSTACLRPRRRRALQRALDAALGPACWATWGRWWPSTTPTCGRSGGRPTSCRCWWPPTARPWPRPAPRPARARRWCWRASRWAAAWAVTWRWSWPPRATPAAALICFGYPLRAAGSGALRDEVLRQLTTPVLFLQGSRDPLCPLPDLETVRARDGRPERPVRGRGRRSFAGPRPQAAGARTSRPRTSGTTQVLDAARRFLAGRGLAPGPEARVTAAGDAVPASNRPATAPC